MYIHVFLSPQFVPFSNLFSFLFSSVLEESLESTSKCLCINKIILLWINDERGPYHSEACQTLPYFVTLVLILFDLKVNFFFVCSTINSYVHYIVLFQGIFLSYFIPFHGLNITNHRAGNCTMYIQQNPAISCTSYIRNYFNSLHVI